MKNNKFLTVFGVFDDKTQKTLKELQNKILEKGFIGKQTMDIPFHISLGSFPVSEESRLVEKIKTISKTQNSFDIKLEKIGFFGDRVVFAEPVVNDKLINLHNEFDNNFANGFAWHAHVTLFIDENEDNVKISKEIAIKNFIPQDAKIVELQMGEFFPTRMIIKEKLKEDKMEELELILPTKEYRTQVEKYKKDMLDAGSGMDGCGSLRKDDFDTWLKKCNDWREGKNLPEGYVSSTQYICVRKSDKKVVGMLQIRHQLSDFLLNYGGHVGDSVAVDERNKGYGKKLLELGLKKCKELGIDRVLVTCKDTNVASRKCILANGGQYEDTRRIEEDDLNLERYWIENE